ncbi:MAG: peptide chain release factor 1 [Dehalococcoidia bacterium]
MKEKLEAIERRYEALTAEMARPEVASDYVRFAELDRERAAIERVVQLYRAYRRIESEIDQARSILEDGSDRDLRDLAREELDGLSVQFEELEQAIRTELLPKDPRDDKNVILEIRAGTGGDEAALFAADLFRMYARYAERRRWQVEILNTSESSSGGFKEVIAEVRGQGAYSRLKYESGGHRVQRVPATEAQGRIHTSTATVAVLPEAEEVDVDVAEKDLRIDIFHSGGAGGQNVNKVATAVRLTHIPTGLVVVCQDERSQGKNRDKAMKVLKSRLLEMERSKQESEVSEARRTQVGTGERAEKIRTYNFPQDRITDHRIGLTVHSLPVRLDGDLDDIIDALITDDRGRQLGGEAA